jgi:hypothetical protein
MNAEQLIELITTLDSVEIERFFVLIKEYEAEVRRRQGATSGAPTDDFKKIAAEVFDNNKELFQKLSEFEAKEHAGK